MSDQVPPAVSDEPLGDMADQASRLQMAEEQAAIRAALAGDVYGSDALEDRGPLIDVLEGPEVLDPQAVDASDDPVYGGGMPVTDPEEAALRASDEESRFAALAMTGMAEDGTAVAIDEGGTLADDAAPVGFEGEADSLTDELPDIDDETAAEDLDALIDVLDLGHDPDDPNDPDGYGMPPDSYRRGAADQTEVRDAIDDAEAP